MTRSTRRTSCGGSPSVIFNPRMVYHHLSTIQHDLWCPSLRAHERHSGRRNLQSLPNISRSEKMRGEGEKGRGMTIKGITSLPSVAWAVPPSPARNFRYVFCAFAYPRPDRAATSLKAINSIRINCAFLRILVQKSHSQNIIIYGA